jgi:hypothetical protein
MPAIGGGNDSGLESESFLQEYRPASRIAVISNLLFIALLNYTIKIYESVKIEASSEIHINWAVRF